MYNNIVNRYEHKHIYKILYGVGYGVPIFVTLIGLFCVWLAEDVFFAVLYDERLRLHFLMNISFIYVIST